MRKLTNMTNKRYKQIVKLRKLRDRSIISKQRYDELIKEV